MLRSAVAEALSILLARARCVLVALCVSSASASTLRAQAPPSVGPSFSWVRLPGAESCIAQAELAANVEARIGRPVFVRPSGALVLIEGRIAPDAAGFEAVIAVSDPDGRLYGERELALAGADCRALDDMVALVIAVTLRGSASGIPLPQEVSAQLEALFGDEPSTLDPSTLPASPPAAVSSEPGRDQPVRASAATPTQRERPVLGAGFDAGMTVATGLQPFGTLAPSARLYGSYRDLLALVFAGGLGIAQQDAVEDKRGTFELRLWYVAASGCVLPGAVLGGTLELCARFAVGRVHADTDGFETNGEDEQYWSELGPEVSVRTPLAGPLYARLGLGLPVRLSLPSFSYVNSEGDPATAFETARLGVLGELALGVALP